MSRRYEFGSAKSLNLVMPRWVDGLLVVVDMNFLLPVSMCGSAGVVLYRNSNPVFTLSRLATTTNTKCDIREAPIDTNGIGSRTLMIRKDTYTPSFFTIYTLFRPPD